ncbi:alpha/beta fold hydrolase [Streptomyces canus]|uniref:alpha/beta hydrolase n=1 Tax=Streptomyces canus TaxID=58343 RepID=UPI003813B062
MSILEVPGARLHYATHGTGPLLLLIPGAGGDRGVFTRIAEQLAPHYTVVTYDRRGFSRSGLVGPQDYDHRLQADADDARRLIEHLGDEPATVFGASSGGIVALELVTAHPTVVRTLVPYEPPAVRELPDGQEWVDFFHEVYDLYRTSGPEAAIKQFRARAFAESDRQTMAHVADAQASEYVRANARYWFEHELRQYPAHSLDLGTLAAHAGRIVPMAGRESRGRPCYEVSVELGRRLGRDVIEMPGGHVGFVAHPAEFAAELVHALASNRRAPGTGGFTS